jgi:uncharacterized protein
LDFRPESAKEVIIVGPPDDPRTKQLLKTVQSRLIPGLILAVVDPANPVEGGQWPLFSRGMLSDKPTAYVCRNLVCRLPVFTPEDLKKMLNEPEGN